MAITLDKVKQTSKTILFEVFNPESKKNLYTFLKNEYEEENTEKFLEYIKELEVRTFEEFLDKFEPTIYEVIVPTKDGFKMDYRIERPNGPHKEIHITKHSFFNMIQRLYKEKGVSGCNNTEFDYTQIREMLTPQYEQKQVKKIRKDLEYNFNKYLELDGNLEKKLDRSKSAKRIMELRKEIVNKYTESPLNLIPLALADVEKKIELIDNQDKNITVEDVSSKKMLGSHLKYDNSGDLILIEGTYEKNNKIESEVNIDNTKSLVTYIEKDFESNAKEGMKNDFIRNLVVSNYVANNSLVAESIEVLENKKENYQKIYKQSQESFIQAISTIIQKIIGVKSFFEHATTNGVLQTPMIVTNCEVSEMIEVEEKLKKLLKDLNSTPEYKIWFALLPGVTLNGEIYTEEVEADEFGIDDLDIELDFDMDTKNESRVPFKASIQESKPLLKILEELRIMTFFNAYANENSGFSNVTRKRIQEYKKVSERNSEYSVFCYPNFTVLPKEKTFVSIGEDLNKENVYLKIPGVYLDSSYVACGIVVGYQHHTLLKSKGFEVNKDFPGVRFDIEKNNNNKIFTTTLNRERQINWGEDVENTINEDSFGFCFSSNQVYNEGKLVSNSYVYLARTLKKNKEGRFIPIYRTLTREFIHNYLSIDKVSESNIKKFMNDECKLWERSAENNPMCVNNILINNEKISYSREEKSIKIKFEKEEEIIDIEIIAE